MQIYVTFRVCLQFLSYLQQAVTVTVFLSKLRQSVLAHERPAAVSCTTTTCWWTCFGCWMHANHSSAHESCWWQQWLGYSTEIHVAVIPSGGLLGLQSFRPTVEALTGIGIVSVFWRIKLILQAVSCSVTVWHHKYFLSYITLHYISGFITNVIIGIYLFQHTLICHIC